MSKSHEYEAESEIKFSIKHGSIAVEQGRCDYTACIHYQFNPHGHAEIIEIDVESVLLDGKDAGELEQELLDKVQAHVTKHFHAA